jgi:hypothetical protein|tara:strand:+ start:118 stop:486 length:369 start_codon:yes stop_codon:yes gene_type:complete
MTIKLLLLKSGEDIVSNVEEMVVGEENSKENPRRVIGYYLNRPCVVKLFKDAQEDKEKGMQVSIYPWMPLAKDQRIPIIADWVVTMVDPVESLTQMYNEDIVNYGNQSSSTDNDSAGTDKSD